MLNDFLPSRSYNKYSIGIKWGLLLDESVFTVIATEDVTYGKEEFVRL